jgi:hypothetical protein
MRPHIFAIPSTCRPYTIQAEETTANPLLRGLWISEPTQSLATNNRITVSTQFTCITQHPVSNMISASTRFKRNIQHPVSKSTLQVQQHSMSELPESTPRVQQQSVSELTLPVHSVSTHQSDPRVQIQSRCAPRQIEPACANLELLRPSPAQSFMETVKSILSWECPNTRLLQDVRFDMFWEPAEL